MHTPPLLLLLLLPFGHRRGAPQAGAERVYAVDGSAGAAEAARRSVKANGLQDRITVITGRSGE